nr:polyprotein [Southwest bike trail virus]
MESVWLLFLPLVGGLLTPAAHRCKVGSEFFLTNCCSVDEISACFQGGCLVAIGCTICDGRCWDIFRPGVATRPGEPAGELVGQFGFLARPLLLSGYVAGILGLGEVYSTALLLGAVMTRDVRPPPNITCEQDCDTALQSEGWELFEDMRQTLWSIEWITTLPWRVWTGLYTSGFLVLALVVLLTLEQRLVMAVLVLAMAGTVASSPLDACQCHPNGSVAAVPGITPAYRGNGTNTCVCPFGQMYWLPDLCHGFAWTNGKKWETIDTWPPVCPARMQGTGSIMCVWGSAYWAYRLGPGVNLTDSVPGSALCHVFIPGTTDRPHPYTDVLSSFGIPCATCIIDRRDPVCGHCTRDCWDETGDYRLSFERCGMGPRVTSHLWAHTVDGGVESKIVSNIGEKPRFPSGFGPGQHHTSVVRALNYTVSEMGGRWHALACPCPPLPRTRLPRYIPGRPVNACLTIEKEKGRLDVAWMAPGGFYAPVFKECNWRPTSNVRVCDGFAFNFPGGKTGFIRSRSGFQQVARSGVFPHPKWLLTDFVFVILVLMKLADARLLPLVALVLWYYFNQMTVEAAPTIRVIFPTMNKTTLPPPPSWTPVVLPTIACPTKTSDVASSMAAAACFATNAVSGAATGGLGYVSEAAQAVVGVAHAGLTKARQFWAGLTWLTNMGLYLPVVDAALAPDIVAAPLVSWAATEGLLVCLLCLLNVYVYMWQVGPVRLAGLVAAHLARGGLPIVLLLACSITRGRHSVLGLEICVSFDQTPSGSDPWLWCVSGVMSLACVVLGLTTVGGARVKLRLYARWCSVYQACRRRLLESFLGAGGRLQGASGAWFAAALVWPSAVSMVTVTLVLIAGLLDLVDYILETLVLTKVSVSRAAGLLDALASLDDRVACSWLARKLEAKGVRLFGHMGHYTRPTAAKLLDWGFALEPLAVTPTDTYVVRDAARTLSCGALVLGLPVVARRGDSVLVGCVRSVGDLPPGYVPAAPVVVQPRGKGFFGVVKTSMTGKDEGVHNGSIMVLGTATSRSMGTCVNGLMFTTYHGTSARTLAGPVGPVNVRWWSTSDDVAVYPMPQGAHCLEACTCQATSGWAIRNDGTLVHGTVGKNLELDIPAELADFRGSSGSPILCDEGHAIGMLVSVLHRGNRVSGIRFTKPWKVKPQDAVVENVAPVVPGSGFREAPLFMPTGSGKSTRVPHEYVKAGHKVLVLNPSVATVRAMGPYMEKITGTHPNVYCGHDTTAYSRTTGSALTYATYGRFLANPRRYLRGKDIVICDECHVTDPTAVLGMGRCRLMAKECGVKLLLFATATPPGAPIAAHESIREVLLGTEGDIPFYGHKLAAETYRHGRHLLFCHSKVECGRLALALTQAGCRAITYYRGGEQDIPDGDVCVCATDALSTGYTGNFSTVTDCCLVVEECVDVTLDPTITISLRTVPASAELRAQRRGRCGRGTSGTYYHALTNSAPSGTLKSGPLWSAVETGLVWYSLEPDLTADILRAYDQCPYTGAITASLGEAVNFYSGLIPMRNYPQVSWAKTHGSNWPLLVGLQRHMCQEASCGPPAEGPDWKGIEGSGPVPLLVRWGNQVPESVAPHHWVDDLQARLGVAEGYSPCYAGPILLFGLAVAGGALLAHYTGSVVIVTAWQVNGGGTPLIRLSDRGVATSAEQPVVTIPQDSGEATPQDAKLPIEAVKLLETSCGWGPMAACFECAGREGLTSACDSVKDAAMRAATMMHAWVSGTFCPPPPTVPAEVTPSLLKTLDSGFTAVWDTIFTNGRSLLVGLAAGYGASRNPPLGVAASFLMGLSAGHQVHVRLAAALLLGVGGTMLGTPGVGLAMAGAYFSGGSISVSWVSILLAVLGGWEGAVNAASLTFDVLTGRAQARDAWCLISCLASPGASVAGVALGILLWSVKRGVGEDWVNRLLTVLPRSSVIPDDYFVKSEFADRVSTILRRLSLSRWLMTLVDKKELEMDTPCSQLLWDLLDWLVRFGRSIGRRVRSMIPSIQVPFVTCSPGWRGDWVGSGHLESRCACGCVVTGDFEDGVLRGVHYSSYFCSNYLKGAIPISVAGSAGGATPLVPTDGNIVYQLGASDWVEARQEGRLLILEASSRYSLSSDELRRCVRGPPMYIGGAPCNWDAPMSAPAMVYRRGQGVSIDDVRQVLPHTIVARPAERPASEELPPPPCETPPPPLESWTEEEERDLVSARAAAIEAISSSLHLPTPESAQAALDALEEAAVSLMPHLQTIMGDDCSCETFEGHFIPEPSVSEIPIDNGETVDSLRAATRAVEDKLAVLNARLESALEQQGSQESLSSSGSSFEQISLSESEPETVIEAGLPMRSKKRQTKEERDAASGSARRLLHIIQRCCQDRSAYKAFPMSLPVCAATAGMGFDLTDHELVDSIGTVIDPLSPIMGVIGDLEVRCRPRHETATSYSYIWSGAPIGTGRLTQPPITRPIGTHLTTDTTRVYVTDPDRACERAEKVTIWRGDRRYDKAYEAVVKEAISKAKDTKSPGWTYEKAAAKVHTHAAAGWGSRMTVKDLHSDTGREAVQKRLEGIKKGAEVPFTLVTKREVFFSKTTRKPPRFICYPPLDFRIAEKMILGDPGIVAKAILGKSYSFQYTPNQRVRVIVDMWKRKRHPIAITVDASCFDSTIDEHDMQVECACFSAASDCPELVVDLCKYYAGGPMVSPDGVPLGHRACRSSGVLTTSSANSITCYIKVKAACMREGLKDFELLIAGDDCLIVYEDDGVDHAAGLGSKLADYGYRATPMTHASLDTAEVCSAYLAECSAGGERRWWLSTDMRKPLARAASEYGDPMASAIGTTLLYPWHPIVRWVLLPHILIMAYRSGSSPDDAVMCQVQGNSYKFPLKLLPSILVSLHGPWCLRVTADSTKTKMEAGQALRDLGMRSLAFYRKRSGNVRTRLLRAGKSWAELARALLWHPGLKERPPDVRNVPGFKLATPYDHFEQVWFSGEKPPWYWKPKWLSLLLVFLAALI